MHRIVDADCHAFPQSLGMTHRAKDKVPSLCCTL